MSENSSARQRSVDRDGALHHVRDLLVALGHDPTCDALRETPRRLVDALLEMTAGYADDPARHLGVQFAEEVCAQGDPVAVYDVPFTSLCEHHLLPFQGLAAVVYIPPESGRVVGLSKLSRALDCFAHRLQMQERIGAQLADALVEHLTAPGAAVLLDSEHGCMTCRGVKKRGARMRTVAYRGVYKTDSVLRTEARALLGL